MEHYLIGSSSGSLAFGLVALQIQWLVDRGMCTATAQKSATANDANAERQVYCSTAGVTPKILSAPTSWNEKCAILCFTHTKYRMGRVIAV
jgi:hypothetical protein